MKTSVWSRPAMRTSAGIAAAAFGLLMCSVSQAQQPPATSPAPLVSVGQPVTEASALAAFRRGNLELIASKYDLEASRADVIAAGVLPNPIVGLNGAFLLHGLPQGGEQSYTITVDQVLPVAGQVGLRRKTANELASAAEKEFAASAWSLASDVRESFLDVQVAQARYNLLNAGLDDLGRVEGILTQRAAAGANPEYDRLRVSVERNNLMGRVAAASGDLGAARTALAQAIGPRINPSTLAVEPEIPESPDPPRDLERVVRLALSQRPEIAAATLRTSAANLRVSQVRREYVPSPDLQVGYNMWRSPPGSPGVEKGGALIVGVGIPIPLFDRGQGRIGRAAAEEQAQRVRATAVELGIRRETMRAAQTMASRVESWRRYRDTTAGQVERMRGIAEVAYREGHSGIIELLDAYRAYLESRERALDLKAEAWRTSLVLERAIGPR